MTLTVPPALKMSIWPSAESFTTTRLGTVCPATKLRSEAVDATPCGETTRSLAAVGLVTVTLMITAVAPDNGTPPWPATVTTMVAPAPKGELKPPVPLRVSTIRDGNRVKNPDPEAELSVKKPLTSTMASAEPSELNIATFPPVPTGTMTRFGTVMSAVQLRLEAKGCAVPVGKTVKYPLEVWFTAVTLTTTALTPVDGMPPAPVTWTFNVAPAASVEPALGWPLPVRVSVMRAGGTGVNWPAVLPPLGAAK